MDNLNSFQRSVIEQCLDKGSGGLTLPMKSGRRRIALMLVAIADDIISVPGVSLIVCNRYTIPVWIEEMKKCGYKDHYEVLHRKYTENMKTWVPKSQTRIILTNIETLTRVYHKHKLKAKVVLSSQNGPDYYIPTEKCILSINEGPEWVFSHKINTLIVDEARDHLNIQRYGCQTLLCIQARRKWLFDRVLFDSPDPKRFLGYLYLLNILNTPHSVDDIRNHIENNTVKHPELRTDLLNVLWNTIVHPKIPSIKQ